MAGVVCSKCDVGWVIYSHDKHCGYCGCKIFDFKVRWEEEPLLYADDGSDIHDLTILVENIGAYPVTFQPLQTTRDNTILFPQSNDSPFEVEAGKFRAVPIQVKLANLERAHEVITVRVQDAPSDFENEKSLRLEALPCPEFKLTPNPVEVHYRRGTEKTTVDLHLEVLQGEFYISDIKVKQGSVLRVGYSKDLHTKNSASKKLLLELDCNQLSDELSVVKLNFEICGLPQPIERRIEIRSEIVPEPPKLFVPPMSLDITQNRAKTHTLMLQNRGERPLTIQNIVFNGPSKLVQLPNLEFPIDIEGGEYHDIEMQISAAGIEPGAYPVNFTINSNCEDVPRYEDVLSVNVKELEAYPHYLAIDFGTTNSCCAYIDLGTFEPKLIPLDNEAKPSEIMPSTIIYHTRPNNGKSYSVGYGAETHRTSEIDGPYYIASVKRWLGYEWGRYFHNNQNIQPCDVVADIFTHIIQQAEKYLDTFTTQSKVNKCIVTYPTMFPHEQRADLRRAFEKIGINDVILIDEGSAASIATVFQRRVKDTSKDYRMLVYDFGGGTIDIVLSEITNNDGEIKFEPLASGGNPRYGGEDVTHAIVEAILEKLETEIRRVNPNLSFEIPYFNSRKTSIPSGKTSIDRARRNNSGILYSQAEKMKRELSEKPETTGYFRFISVIVQGDTRPLESLTQDDVTVGLSTQQLQKIIEPGLSKTFDNIDAMIEANDARLPDIVILAGQSSKMRAVKQMMHAHFQNKYGKSVDVQLGDPPKECVVLGAAEYGRHHIVPDDDGDWINYADLSNITHSRLGIVKIRGRQPIFSEIIPKGKRIPNNSRNTVDFPLRSQETYIDVHEHFGTDDDLANSSQVASYTLTLPENVTKEELQKARLEMSVKVDGEIELIALVGGEKYDSTVKKKKPPFVDKI